MLQVPRTLEGDEVQARDLGAKRLAYFPPSSIAWGRADGWDDVIPTGWRPSKGARPQTHSWRLRSNGTFIAGVMSDAATLQRHSALMNKRSVHMLAFGPNGFDWTIGDDDMAELTYILSGTGLQS